MAVRYSGDVEVRMNARGRLVQILIRAPRIRLGTHMALTKGERLTSKTYDRIASKALLLALRRRPSLPVDRGSGGGVIVNRVFVSPCPWKV